MKLDIFTELQRLLKYFRHFVLFAHFIPSSSSFLKWMGLAVENLLSEIIYQWINNQQSNVCMSKQVRESIGHYIDYREHSYATSMHLIWKSESICSWSSCTFEVLNRKSPKDHFTSHTVCKGLSLQHPTYQILTLNWPLWLFASWCSKVILCHFSCAGQLILSGR